MIGKYGDQFGYGTFTDRLLAYKHVDGAQLDCSLTDRSKILYMQSFTFHIHKRLIPRKGKKKIKTDAIIPPESKDRDNNTTACLPR